VGEISKSANQLSLFVDQVLSATGASRVDIVGHSQGGMMPRYYINFLGGDNKVNALVGLAPSNHGTTLNGLFTLASYFPGASQFATADCPACAEQEAGSPFLTQLNGGGETRSGVTYTVIESQNDEVVTPYTSAFLLDPGVTNIVLQTQCALDQGEHLSMPYDHIADTDVLNALNPTAQPFPTVCTPVAPVSGG
jgi:triacylglycerol esterase/lipase EstA (alpha/beta hydrolase family)